mgnify:CR=1 FL=1
MTRFAPRTSACATKTRLPHVRLGALLFLFTIGCSPFSPPTVEQVKRDLVGQSFENPGGWAEIKVVSVESLEIKERSTDRAAKTDELRALVNLTSKYSTSRPGVMTFQGVLVIRYRHFEQGWKIQSVEIP